MAFAHKAVYLHPAPGEPLPAEHTITFKPSDEPGSRGWPDWGQLIDNTMVAKEFTVRFTNGVAWTDERLADHLVLHYERVHHELRIPVDRDH